MLSDSNCEYEDELHCTELFVKCVKGSKLEVE